MDSKAFRSLSYGVYLVTTRDKEGKNVGCIANSAFQVTSTPPQILVSLNHDNDTCRAIKESGALILNVLSEKVSMDLISTFGYHSSRDIDKFKGYDVVDKDGMPFIKIGVSYFILKVRKTFETETHTLFLAEVIDCEVLSSEKEMTYAYFHQVKKGSAPKNAPTYQAASDEKKETKKHRFRCKVCGYLYETELDELPDDFICPLCGAPKNKFVKVY